jgi:hypothetical protein
VTNVLLTEGFDMYNGVGSNTGVRALWNATIGASSSGGDFSMQGGRFGGQALRIQGGGGFAAAPTSANRLFNGLGNTTSFSAGIAINALNGINSGRLFEFANTGFGVQCGVGINSNGSIYCYQGAGGTTFATTAAGVLTTSTWVYIEVEVVISASVGSMNVYMNGASMLSVSSVNTFVSGGSGVGYVQLWAPINSNTSFFLYYDDIYVTDTATRLGESRVETLRPSSDSVITWTPDTGANNYGRVSDSVVDGDSSYVQTSTVGNRDLYGITALSSTPATIFAVNTVMFAEKTDSTTRTLQATVKSGGTDSLATAVNLSASYQRYDYILMTDPHTSAAWTSSGVNNLLIGPKLAS